MNTIGHNVSFLKIAGAQVPKGPVRRLAPLYKAEIHRNASVICDFAKAVLLHPLFQDKQLMFVGRSMDLAFYAAIYLTLTSPDFEQRFSDVFLVDYSTRAFMPGKITTYRQISNYLQSCGLNPKREVVVVDDEFSTGATVRSLVEMFRETGWQTVTRVALVNGGLMPLRTPNYPTDYSHRATRMGILGGSEEVATFLNDEDTGLRPVSYNPARKYRVEVINDKIHLRYADVDLAQWLATRRTFLQFCMQYWAYEGIARWQNVDLNELFNTSQS